MNLINFSRFKAIIEAIQDYDKKRERIDKFFEEEIMEGSYCMITVGDQIHSTLIAMLADEFNCWYSTTKGKPTHWWKNPKQFGISNEIEWWLYESDDKTIEIGEKIYNVVKLGDFYDYLIENYYLRTPSDLEFSEESIVNMTDEDRIEILKNLFNSQIWQF